VNIETGGSVDGLDVPTAREWSVLEHVPRYSATHRSCMKMTSVSQSYTFSLDGDIASVQAQSKGVSTHEQRS
jgi:hypothetical protein